MPAVDLPDALADPLPANFVELGVFSSRAEAEEHGLVILALGHPYWLLPRADHIALVAESELATLARRHLERYARDRLRWPPPPIADPWAARKAEILTPLLWAAVILALHAFATPWKSAASFDSVAIVQHRELWRVFTALFFHADAPHVLSNILGGLLVLTALLSTVGRARGWLLLALCSTAANLALAFAHHPQLHRSLGASTAIFAAVGLLTGRAVRVVTRTTHPHRWRALFVPLASGGTVLALHGAGAAHIDLGAHLAGFLAGTFGGFVAGLRRST